MDCSGPLSCIQEEEEGRVVNGKSGYRFLWDHTQRPDIKME